MLSRIYFKILNVHSCDFFFFFFIHFPRILAVRAWRMLCEHAVKVSRSGKFLFIERGTTVNRFENLFFVSLLVLYQCIQVLLLAVFFTLSLLDS